MGVFDKWNGEQFKDRVKKAMEDNNLTPSEFDELHRQYRDLNGLVAYAVSSWMAGSYPGLEGALRSGSYENWQATR